MKLLTVGLALVGAANAHYIFQSFNSGTAYEHIRRNTNYNSPVTDLSSTDLRCNVGGGSGASTETATVPAGSSVNFRSDVAVYHQGPVSFYMSKAPGNAASYDGSGNWFKIGEVLPTFNGCSATWNLASTYSVTIPKSTPSGEYLLRIEQLAIHNPGGIPQFYISCAQVTVTGGGSGSPSPVVKIPGHVKASDPGYTANIYNNFCSYTNVGPAVWRG